MALTHSFHNSAVMNEAKGSKKFLTKKEIKHFSFIRSWSAAITTDCCQCSLGARTAAELLFFIYTITPAMRI